MEAMSPLPLCHWAPWAIHSRSSWYAQESLPKRTWPPCCDLAGGLEEQQAGVGVGEVDAPAVEVAGEGVVVLFGVVAEQGQAEAALALEGAVAGAGVAAHAAEHAHDVALEIDLLHGRAAGQLDLGAGGAGDETEDAGGQEGDAESGHGFDPCCANDVDPPRGVLRGGGGRTFRQGAGRSGGVRAHRPCNPSMRESIALQKGMQEDFKNLAENGWRGCASRSRRSGCAPLPLLFPRSQALLAPRSQALLGNACRESFRFESGRGTGRETEFRRRAFPSRAWERGIGNEGPNLAENGRRLIGIAAVAPSPISSRRRPGHAVGASAGPASRSGRRASCRSRRPRTIS